MAGGENLPPDPRWRDTLDLMDKINWDPLGYMFSPDVRRHVVEFLNMINLVGYPYADTKATEPEEQILWAAKFGLTTLVALLSLNNRLDSESTKIPYRIRNRSKKIPPDYLNLALEGALYNSLDESYQPMHSLDTALWMARNLEIDLLYPHAKKIHFPVIITGMSRSTREYSPAAELFILSFADRFVNDSDGYIGKNASWPNFSSVFHAPGQTIGREGGSNAIRTILYKLYQLIFATDAKGASRTESESQDPFLFPPPGGTSQRVAWDKYVEILALLLRKRGSSEETEDKNRVSNPDEGRPDLRDNRYSRLDFSKLIHTAPVHLSHVRNVLRLPRSQPIDTTLSIRFETHVPSLKDRETGKIYTFHPSINTHYIRSPYPLLYVLGYW
jgi:hypothetical protein